MFADPQNSDWLVHPTPVRPHLFKEAIARMEDNITPRVVKLSIPPASHTVDHYGSPTYRVVSGFLMHHQTPPPVSCVPIPNLSQDQFRQLWNSYCFAIRLRINHSQRHLSFLLPSKDIVPAPGITASEYQSLHWFASHKIEQAVSYMMAAGLWRPAFKNVRQLPPASADRMPKRSTLNSFDRRAIKLNQRKKSRIMHEDLIEIQSLHASGLWNSFFHSLWFRIVPLQFETLEKERARFQEDISMDSAMDFEFEAQRPQSGSDNYYLSSQRSLHDSSSSGDEEQQVHIPTPPEHLNSLYPGQTRPMSSEPSCRTQSHDLGPASSRMGELPIPQSFRPSFTSYSSSSSANTVSSVSSSFVTNPDSDSGVSVEHFKPAESSIMYERPEEYGYGKRSDRGPE